MPETLIGLIEMPVSWRGGFDFIAGRFVVDEFDQIGGFRLAAFKFDAGVQVFGVFADDDQIDRHAFEEAADAFVLLAGPDAGVQAEGLPQIDVDAAKAGADGRGDRRLQRTLGALHAFHGGVRQRRAGAGHDVDAGFLDVPVDFDAGGVDALAGSLGQLRTGAIADNQRHVVCHVDILSTK